MSLGIGLLYGPTGGGVLMNEVPLWVGDSGFRLWDSTEHLELHGAHGSGSMPPGRRAHNLLSLS